MDILKQLLNILVCFSLICIRKCTWLKFGSMCLWWYIQKAWQMTQWQMNKGFSGQKKIALSNAHPSPVSSSRKRWPPSATSRTHRNLWGYQSSLGRAYSDFGKHGILWSFKKHQNELTLLKNETQNVYLRGRELSSRSSINGRCWQTRTKIHTCHNDWKPCNFLPVKNRNGGS